MPPFAPRDLLAELRLRDTSYPEPLRTHIVSAVCTNAAANHAGKYPDLRSIAHGQYELTTEAGERGRHVPRD